jgi:hypothetical protein
VLPALAPCTSPHALVRLERGERVVRRLAPALDAGGSRQLVFPRPTRGSPRRAAGAPWPWRRLLAEPRTSEAGVEVRAALEGAGA